MNPEQPSRDQIEARITALLLGELPAAEAELLRWTISQDPELQKLHEQLKLTIGFVREAMKNPPGVPAERDRPLKLTQERRQTLLAHFKTARPQPQQSPQSSQELSWLKRIKIPSRNSLVAAAVTILLICGLVAISIPNFVKARATSQQNACINNLRQIEAAKNEWALETHQSANAVPTANDLTPYLADNKIHSVAGETYVLGKVSEPAVADFNGKRLIAGQEYASSARIDHAVASKKRQAGPQAVNEYKLEARATPEFSNSAGANSGVSAVPPTPAPIALPNTELADNAGRTVYQQNVVGYANVTYGASSAGYSSKPRQEEPKNEPNFAFNSSTSQSEATTPSPMVSRYQYRLPGPETAQPSVPPAPQIFVSSADSSANQATDYFQLGEQAPTAPAGGNYTVTTLAGNASPQPALKGLPESAGERNGQSLDFFLGNQRAVNGPIENGIFQNKLQNNAPDRAIKGFPAPNVTGFNFSDLSSSGSVTNAVAMDGGRNAFYRNLNNFGNLDADRNPGALATRAGQNAQTGGGFAGLPSARDQAVYAYQLHNANPNEVAAALKSTFETSGRGGDQSAFANRESQNATTVSQNSQTVTPTPQLVPPPQLPRESENANAVAENSDSLQTITTTPLAVPPTAGIAGNAPAPPVFLPPRLQRQRAQNAQKLNESPGKSQITAIPAAVTEAVEAPPPANLAVVPQEASNIDKLKSQYAEEEAQIQSMQGEVDQLRKKDHIRDFDPSAPAATPSLSAEQVQALNEKMIEQKALCIKLEKELGEFETVQASDPTKLADVLLTISPDTQLSDLRDKLHEDEERYANETHLGRANSDSASTLGLINTEKQQIKDRVAGIMYGLQAQAVAAEAQVAGFTNQLNEVEAESQDKLGRGQDYWIAKAKLQDKEDLHRMLGEKIEADEADAATPKSALVTIVNPATPAQSQSLWQRLTGTFESTAQIELQPDISTAGTPIEYAAYDPYFMETEVKSIQSDAVLGKVVDSLKLDQKWSKPSDNEKLSRNDAIAQLRSRLDLESDKNTKLIDIDVKSDKADEAANIANAVAEAYKQYRLETHSNEMVVGIEKLKQQFAEEEKELRQFPAEVRQMDRPAPARNVGKPLNPPKANPVIPQPEIQTSDNAFSTFSMNVSDVSFKLAMASLQKGQMPDSASIRSEEFINAFDYHDPEPLQGEPLAFVSERAADPFVQERDLLRFSIKAAAAGRQDGRALNLVLLLDTSGSMERADRVAIIREMLRVLSAQLQPQDVVSVVTFARTARLWADGIPGDQAGATLDKVGNITPEGGTNLEEAMRLAYETALRHFIAGGMNRVVMLTDGAANLGNVDPKALTQTVDWQRGQGIALDCFGIGWDDYNDDLLEQLSSNGDGRYAFINSPDEAATEFAAKLAGALQVAAEDVKVQVEFNPNRVTAWRQIGYAKHQLTKEQFRDNTVAAGAIAAREAGNALYAIETNPNGEGPIATVRVRYRVPGTQDVHEKSWLVDYTGAAPELAQSSSAMRLAVTAAEISEWMADSPFAQNVTPDELLNYLSSVPQFYGTDERPKQLEWMIREAKSVSGK